jgi:sulfate permease, SulP family
VSIGTFNWNSIRNLRTHLKSSSVVMLATVIVVVATHNLALGVGVGVLLSALFFAGKVSQLLDITSQRVEGSGVRTYHVRGQLFFVSASTFADAFDFREVVEQVRIDVSHAHFWDLSAVTALDKVVLKFRREGTAVELIGMNEASRTLVDRLALHDKPGAMDQLGSH